MNLKKNRIDKFIDHYVINFNATQAAAEAGYSNKTARAQGSRLLTKVDIQDRIKNKLNSIGEKNGIDQQFVLQKLRKIAEANLIDYYDFPKRGGRIKLKKLDELSRDQAYAIKKIKPIRYGKSITYEIELESKLSALHDLALYTKVLNGEQEGGSSQTLVINQNITYEGVSDEVVKKYGYNSGRKESLSHTKPPSKARSG